ncbi:MAG: PH domain-containing protein [Alphaproteobacteria bacterium]|nr:PH domain-containing protein [Alphaproteobacteria bacterium]
MLDTGERVVFRARHGPVDIALHAAIRMATVLVGALLSFILVNDTNEIFFSVLESGLDWRVVAALGAFWAGSYARTISNHIIMVTDRRVLYRHGTWWRKVTEIPLNDIKNAGPDLAFGNYSYRTWIERVGGGRTIVVFVPRLLDLQRAVAAQCGFPPPQQFDAIVYFGGFLTKGSSNLFSVAAPFLPNLIAKGLLFDLELAPIGHTAAGFAAASLISFIFLTVAYVAGRVLGHFAGLVVLRFILTLDQARQVVCMGYASIPPNRIAIAVRWYVRQTARFASWLYGQEIRCD